MTNNTTPDDIVCYLLLRTDLESMGRGKAYAHAMHAGNQLTHELLVKPLQTGEYVDPNVIAWHEQGGGFGTTLSVGGHDQITLARLEGIKRFADLCGYPAGIVRDNTYPYRVSHEMLELINPSYHTKDPVRSGPEWTCFRSEVTAGWILGSKSALEPLLARYSLTPND